MSVFVTKVEKGYVVEGLDDNGQLVGRTVVWDWLDAEIAVDGFIVKYDVVRVERLYIIQ